LYQNQNILGIATHIHEFNANKYYLLNVYFVVWKNHKHNHKHNYNNG